MRDFWIPKSRTHNFSQTNDGTARCLEPGERTGEQAGKQEVSEQGRRGACGCSPAMFRSKSKRGFFGRWGTKRAGPASSVSLAAAASAARRGNSGNNPQRRRGTGRRRRSGGDRAPRMNRFAGRVGGGGGGGTDVSSGASSSGLSSSDLSSSEDDDELDDSAFGGQGGDAMWRMVTPKGGDREEGAPMLSASDRMELNALLDQANDLLVDVVGNLPTMTPAAGSATATRAPAVDKTSDLASFRNNLAASLSLSEKELFDELLRWEIAASRGNADKGDPVSELRDHLDQLDADLAEACRHLDERLKPLLEFHERTRRISSEASKLLLQQRVNIATGTVPRRGRLAHGGLIAVRQQRR